MSDEKPTMISDEELGKLLDERLKNVKPVDLGFEAENVLIKLGLVMPDEDRPEVPPWLAEVWIRLLPLGALSKLVTAVLAKPIAWYTGIVYSAAMKEIGERLKKMDHETHHG